MTFTGFITAREQQLFALKTMLHSLLIIMAKSHLVWVSFLSGIFLPSLFWLPSTSKNGGEKKITHRLLCSFFLALKIKSRVLSLAHFVLKNYLEELSFVINWRGRGFQAVPDKTWNAASVSNTKLNVPRCLGCHYPLISNSHKKGKMNTSLLRLNCKKANNITIRHYTFSSTEC